MKKQYNAPVARAIKFDYERVVAESKCINKPSFELSDMPFCMDLLTGNEWKRSSAPCTEFTQ